MKIIEEYIDYLAGVKRYSPRTQDVYRRGIENFVKSSGAGDDDSLIASLKPVMIRNWEVDMLDPDKGDALGPRTVNLNLSVLSSFCKYLMAKDLILNNPVSQVKRPKVSKRLPVFYRKDAMGSYLESTKMYADGSVLELYPDALPLCQRKNRQVADVYGHVLRRMIVSMLYSTGIRRAELISLNISDVDFSRGVIRVTGKGDKMREIPLVSTIIEEISLYLKTVELMVKSGRRPEEPLLITPSGRRLYPELVDKAVKTELGTVEDIKGRKSPHALRHTLATELLEEGSDLNSIKELLGHASLAATQVYTHNSIAQLKKVYETAHPRAKNGGNNGD